MKETRIIMGMPIAIDIADAEDAETINAVFDFFTDIDRRFSPFRDDSEVAALNRGVHDHSDDMLDILTWAERTKEETDGYFDVVRHDSRIDPSGITKGWAIRKAADMIRVAGYRNFLIDAGGDIHSEGHNGKGEPWQIGIRDPFDAENVVKVIAPRGAGVATSGSSVRGAHIYDPHDPHGDLSEIVSMTVIGPDILEADRFATAAFAMGKDGVIFIESLPGFEAYAIDRSGIATMTSNFNRYVVTI
ncbi:MAG TPA: FAD:protein FMN transferase [Candidatus Paceibacterota bacterium]